MKKVDILAIGAHPDDIELSCSGTLLKHQKLGHTIGLLDLTMGQLGSRGTPELRIQESMTACSLLRAEYRHNLKWEDGFFEENQEHLIDLIREIRYAQPKIILANALKDRHPDHGRAGFIIQRAVFLSGLVKIKTTYEGREQPPWRPIHLFHYIQDRYVAPDFIVDISSTFSEKIKTISCYSSQFYNPDSKEPQTPISSEDFWRYIESKDRYYGRQINATYGEGFVSERTLGVQNIFSLQ